MSLRAYVFGIILAIFVIATAVSFIAKPLEPQIQIDAHSPGVWQEVDADGKPGVWPPTAAITKPEPPTAGKMPQDSLSRSKFPTEDPAQVDRLSFVNDLANRSIVGMSDAEHYSVLDRWVSWPDDGLGDCEDYAISKLVTLSAMGEVPGATIRLRFVTLASGQAHALLEVKMAKGSIAFLDNIQRELMTRPELERAGYHFFDW